MHDYVVRGLAAQGKILAMGARTTNLVEEARQRHGTYPTATAALGRALTAVALLGQTLKAKETITLRVEGGGPIGWIIADADSEGHVRGYVKNPQIDLPATPQGKLAVGAAVGKEGHLYITRDPGLKEPYTGSAQLVSGEIAEDLAHYFAYSEQTPTAVALGVKVDKEGGVLAAGGFLLQFLPGGQDEELARDLEGRLAQLKGVTQLLEEGLTPEEILQEILGSWGVQILERRPVDFRCRCSREKAAASLLTLPQEELEEMAAGKGGQVRCHFCNTLYEFSPEEVRALLTPAAAEERP